MPAHRSLLASSQTADQSLGRLVVLVTKCKARTIPVLIQKIDFKVRITSPSVNTVELIAYYSKNRINRIYTTSSLISTHWTQCHDTPLPQFPAIHIIRNRVNRGRSLINVPATDCLSPSADQYNTRWTAAPRTSYGDVNPRQWPRSPPQSRPMMDY